ncbi:MAG: NAD-dependent protein deacylase [Promethearchaeota archaeon]
MNTLKFEDREKIKRIARLLLNSKHAIALTGAGISTESGIPDFRGEGGIWEKYQADIYGNIKEFIRDPSKFWEMAKKVAPMLFSAKPNKGHFALAELEKLKIIKAIVTQNFDELHQKAGSIIVYEVHGNINRFNCLGCRGSYPKEEILRKLKKNKEYPPLCDVCSAPLKPSVVLFGEDLPLFELYQSQALAQKTDVMLIVGSSLCVAPISYLPIYTLREKGKLIIINDKPTHLDESAEIIINNKIGLVLPLIIEEIKKMKKDKTSIQEK